MTDRELMDKAWDYLASYTVGERPNASEVNDLVFALERRLAQPERQWVGLTDEDMAELRRSGLHEISDKHFRAVESKLKEKNT